MDQKTLFLNTSPTRLFFKAALPGSVGMLASSLYQLLDGMFVGQLLGGEAFAALNLAMPLVIINFAISDLIGVGSSVPISVRLGEKRPEEANNIFTCACLMVLLQGLVVGSFLFFASPVLLRWMGAEGSLLRLATQYIRVYAVSSPITGMMYATDNYLRICGQIKASMWLNVAMSTLCALGEFLMLGVLGVGVWGAAFGSCMGMVICVLVGMWPFFRGQLQLRFRRPHFTRSIIRQIVFCGTPTFLNNIAGRVTSILMNTVLLRVGGAAAVSVYGILMYADGIVMQFLYGMCDSLQPAVGYNWGAGRRDRVLAIEKRCFSAAAIISLLGATVLYAFPEAVTSVFVADSEPAVYAMAIPALRLFCLGYLTRWLSFATQSFMSAVEHPIQASILSVSTALVFPVLLIAVLWPFGLNGLWFNMAGTALLTCVVAVIILLDFRRRNWNPGATR